MITCYSDCCYVFPQTFLNFADNEICSSHRLFGPPTLHQINSIIASIKIESRSLCHLKKHLTSISRHLYLRRCVKMHCELIWPGDMLGSDEDPGPTHRAVVLTIQDQKIFEQWKLSFHLLSYKNKLFSVNSTACHVVCA